VFRSARLGEHSGLSSDRGTDFSGDGVPVLLETLIAPVADSFESTLFGVGA